MKPKIFLKTTFIFFLLSFVFAQATVRYVSPAGSSTPPYTSWATAADSIMECINISVFGDTIYVANGTYKEQVVMIPGLSLIGAGMDSCVIDTRELVYSGFQALIVHDMGTVKYFRFLISNDGIGTGVYTDAGSGEISHNYFLNPSLGVALDNTSVLLELNFFISTNNGAFILGLITPSNPKIYNNIIEATEDGIGFSVGSDIKPEIINNIFILQDDFAGAYGGSLTDTVKIFNNLVIAEAGRYGFANSIIPTLIDNNTIIGNISYKAINAENYNQIIGNNVFNGDKGIIQEAGDEPLIKYNNSYNNLINYGGFFPDSTNLSVDPMIVNDDSTKGDLDFHLQMYSPLIDAGDPNILDVDGTRSDIGLYGGPYGESYSYNDLAPRTPVNLNATLDSLTVGITWNKNTEADFNHYKVYRDTTKNFQIDSTNFYFSTPVSNFIDILPDYVEKIYYKVTAVDNQGNESEPSEEVGFILTSITDHQLLTTDYRLYQNYPNPFNPSTTISYRLKERGYVKLYVYDIKGELVSVLVNQTQEAGFYEVDFVGNGLTTVLNNSDLSSGIYIYQIMVKNENNIPVFTDMKKMLLIK